MQRTLKPSQLENFYHDQFVSQQVEHFRSIALSEIDITKFVVDVGGGCGYFSIALQKQLGLKLRLIDMDPIFFRYHPNIGINNNSFLRINTGELNKV